MWVDWIADRILIKPMLLLVRAGLNMKWDIVGWRGDGDAAGQQGRNYKTGRNHQTFKLTEIISVLPV